MYKGGFGIHRLLVRCAPSLFTSYANLAKDQSQRSTHTWQLHSANPQLHQHYETARTICYQLTNTFTVPPTTEHALQKLNMKTLLSKYFEYCLIEYVQNCNGSQNQAFTAHKAFGANLVISQWPKSKETQLTDFPFIHAIRTRLGRGLPEFFGIPPPAAAPPCHACNNLNHRIS